MTQQAEDRFTDTGQSIYDLMDEVWVVCPHCSARAVIRYLDPEKPGLFAPRRLTCLSCGYNQTWAKKHIRRGWSGQPVVDDFFSQPIWLQTTCVGEILWAYNAKHLALLEEYVRAKHRTHQRPGQGKSTATLINRLPKWIRWAKHREAVLRAIRRLKAKAAKSA
jgi:hypothetical protein